ncbi:MAG TPA: carboxypeptidase regulatory-like domain-containing protein [Terriglobia bacterium]|nr:carboxypeptidase regulatory-like domain-containing protein [Terriglobia bacterium]
MCQHASQRKWGRLFQARALFFLGLLAGVGVPMPLPRPLQAKPVAPGGYPAQGSSAASAQTGPQAPHFSHPASSQNKADQGGTDTLLVLVNDENGLAVPLARVYLVQPGTHRTAKGETNYAGRYTFKDLAPGNYQLLVQKEGFYAVRSDNVAVGTVERTEVTLNRVREVHQKVNVVASPIAINPASTISTRRLSDTEIMNLPYDVPRDIRYALPLIPGIVQDATGQLHINGAPTRQILDQLDGFNITDPASGNFDARVAVDALRSVSVYGSRYPAQYGKSSGGVIDLETGMGDDRYRFSGTDFLPSIATHKGFHLDGWTPHGSFSGPIKKGKAWFLVAPESEYDLELINELPPGADSNTRWRLGNLAKTQINLTPSNILTSEFFFNDFRSDHSGLSRFNPVETTTRLSQSVYHFSTIDQFTLSNGALVEYGIGFSRFHVAELPQGNATYVLTPKGSSGNYFEQGEARSQRLQVIANVIAPTLNKWGSHEMKTGFDFDRVTNLESFNRHGISILRQDGTLSRTVSFPGNPIIDQANFETGVYGQDHWSITHRLVLDPGLRIEWDRIAPGARVSPRVAASFTPSAEDNTKIVGGVGIYYDESNIDLYTQPRSGTRIDYFYDPTGTSLIRPPVESVFQIDRQNFKKPWVLNWSVGVERKLPADFFLRTEYLQKSGYDEWTYVNPCAGPQGCFTGQFPMESTRRDRYDAVDVAVRRRFQRGHVIYAAFTHSVSRSNAVLDFNVLNPYFSPQGGGRLPWDTPNRIVSYGILPLIREFDLAYTLDWYQGFPFSVVNENQELVGAPDRLRYPAHFTLNMALERRISLFGFRWQLRAGFDDITDRHNPYSVDNNIDSPTYLTYGSTGGRSLTGQVRLLGRN